MMWVILPHTSDLDPYKGTHPLGKTASTGQSILCVIYKINVPHNLQCMALVYMYGD